MKRITWMLTMCVGVLLAACSGGQEHAAAHPPAMPQAASQDSAQMQQLQLLIVQAVSLAVLPGDVPVHQSADILRRAMSGPEMNTMHHGGSASGEAKASSGMDMHAGMVMPASTGDSMPGGTMMQQTHDLGDAAFELLAANPQGENDMQWRGRVALAALAAAMRLEGVLLGGPAGEFESTQGRLLAEGLVAGSAAQPLPVESDYAKAASLLIPALQIL